MSRDPLSRVFPYARACEMYCRGFPWVADKQLQACLWGLRTIFAEFANFDVFCNISIVFLRRCRTCILQILRARPSDHCLAVFGFHVRYWHRRRVWNAKCGCHLQTSMNISREKPLPKVGTMRNNQLAEVSTRSGMNGLVRPDSLLLRV